MGTGPPTHRLSAMGPFPHFVGDQRSYSRTSAVTPVKASTLAAMALRHDEGIVLRSYPFGEADRVVVLVSPQSGKLRTVAKGIRKTKSRFGGRLESFSYVDLVLYEGRNLDIITQVEMMETYPRLRSDLDRVTAASTMTEVVDAVAQEGQPSVALFDLLRRGLVTLNMAPAHSDIVTAFLLQVAEIVGIAPAFEACAICGRTAGLDRFGMAVGGVVCSSCVPQGAVRLRAGLIPYLAELARAELGNLPPTNPAISPEAMGVTRRFVEYHLDRRLVSIASLDSP